MTIQFVYMMAQLVTSVATLKLVAYLVDTMRKFSLYFDSVNADTPSRQQIWIHHYHFGHCKQRSLKKSTTCSAPYPSLPSSETDFSTSKALLCVVNSLLDPVSPTHHLNIPFHSMLSTLNIHSHRKNSEKKKCHPFHGSPRRNQSESVNIMTCNISWKHDQQNRHDLMRIGV